MIHFQAQKKNRSPDSFLVNFGFCFTYELSSCFSCELRVLTLSTLHNYSVSLISLIKDAIIENLIIQFWLLSDKREYVSLPLE